MGKGGITKNIIVYDFDKTIYGGESGTNYFQFYFTKYPLKGFIFALKYIKEVLFYLLKITNLKQLKERFFIFLENHSKEEIEKITEEFWKKYKKLNYSWTENELLKNKEEADMVIVSSATPKFIIEKFLLGLGYDYVFGTDFEGDEKEKFIAKIKGENNKGEEKVRKLNEWAEKNNIEYKMIKFYSDSLADKPLFDLSEKKYWIKKGKKIEGMPTKKTLLDIFFWK